MYCMVPNYLRLVKAVVHILCSCAFLSVHNNLQSVWRRLDFFFFKTKKNFKPIALLLLFASLRCKKTPKPQSNYHARSIALGLYYTTFDMHTYYRIVFCVDEKKRKHTILV